MSERVSLLTIHSVPVKGLPGCFFARYSLLKSSNNLEPIGNDVNIKCSRLVLSRIISVTSTFTVRKTHTTHVNFKKMKVIIFPISLYLTIHSPLLSLPLSTAFVV